MIVSGRKFKNILSCLKMDGEKELAKGKRIRRFDSFRTLLFPI
jgi:hypothetical protein